MTSLIYNQKWNEFVEKCEAETLKESVIQDAAKNAVDYVKNAFKYFEEKSTEVIIKVLDMGIHQLHYFILGLYQHKLIDDNCQTKLRFIVELFKHEKYIKIWASVVKYIIEEIAENKIFKIIKFINKVEDAAGNLIAKIPPSFQEVIEKVTFFFENIGDILMDMYAAYEVWDLAFNNQEDFLEFLQVIKITDNTFSAIGYSCKTKNTLEPETT